MSITAKEYLDMIAADLGEMFPGAAVRSDGDGDKGILGAKYTLPNGIVTDVVVTLVPAENDMLAAQIIVDLSGAIPSEINGEFFGKLSEINNGLTYGSVNFESDDDNRYCLYNYGFFIDIGLDLRDITVLLGRSIADAELEFCSEDVCGLFGTIQGAQE